MSSTETGVIFGNIVYDAAGQLDRNVVVLNDIHIDIMDYISPAYCADVAFRNMWAEFEWENKVRSMAPLVPAPMCTTIASGGVGEPCIRFISGIGNLGELDNANWHGFWGRGYW